MLVLSIGAAVLSSMLTLAVEWWRGGCTVQSFKETWKQWPTYLIPPLTITLLWVGTFGRALFLAPFNDHQSLVGSRTAAELDARHWKVEAQRAPPATPASSATNRSALWTWEAVKPTAQMSGKPGVTVLITARGPISDMIFDVECNVPCELSPDQSMATGFMSGTWFDTKSSPAQRPTVVRVKVLVPNRLDVGNGLALYFVSKEDHELNISRVSSYKKPGKL